MGIISHMYINIYMLLLWATAASADLLDSANVGRRSSVDFWRFSKFRIFVKKLSFGYFGESLDTRGVWKCQFFWFLVDLKILIFWVFLVGLKILVGSYGAVLVGVSMM